MTPDATTELLPIADPYETAVDETIALCGGDARQAVKVLLVANEFLERELELAKVAVSRGYSRGRYAQTADQETRS